MSPWDVAIVVFLIVVALAAGFYFLNKWAAKRMEQQQSMIEKSRTVVNIFVIDKKRDKFTNVNLPKAAVAQMPKIAKYMKMYFVQAKIGPQIMTLMCEKKVYNAIPVKRNVKVGLAGLYIVDIPGMKSEEQMKQEKKVKDKAKKDEQEKTGFSLSKIFKK